MTRMIATLLGLLCLAAPSSSQAQQVGLAPFSGPRHRVVRRAVRAALEDRVNVTDLDSEEPDGVDAVVTGTTRGSRSRPRLTLVLTDRSGTERARETLRVAQNRRGERAVARAVGSLLSAAGDLSPSSEVPDQPYPDEPAAQSQAEPEPPADEAPDRQPSEPSSSDPSAIPYLHLLAGLSLRNREIIAELPGATELRGTIPLYPEVLVEARVRPLAGSDDRLLAGIRIRARFGYAPFFEYATPSGQVIAGTAWSLEGDAGWLAPLDDAGIMELGATVGGGYTTYAIDDNAFVPGVDYASFEARAVTRVRAFQEDFVIRAELGYRYAAGSGPLVERHGSLEGHGVVVEGGFEGAYALDDTVGLSWLAAVEWQNVGLSFSGAPSGQLANGGVDGFVRLRLGVGLALR